MEIGRFLLTEQERGAPPPCWLKAWGGDGIIARIEPVAIGRQLVRCGVPIIDLECCKAYKGVSRGPTQKIRRSQSSRFNTLLNVDFETSPIAVTPDSIGASNECQHFRHYAESAGYQFHEHQSVHRYAQAFDAIAEKQRIVDWIRDLPRPTEIVGYYDLKHRRCLTRVGN